MSRHPRWVLAVPVLLLLSACATSSPAPSASPDESAASAPAGAEHAVTFTSGPDSLPGTYLRAAGGSALHPAALIISGSGPTDRDGNDVQLPHLDTNLNLAKALAADGVDSLRYDKLGSGRAGLGAHPGGTGIDFDLFADEVRQAFRALAAQPGVDPDRLLVVGHSEGALFALSLATELHGTPNAPRALILAAPPGSRYLDLLTTQAVAGYRQQQAAGRISQSAADTYVNQLQQAVTTIRATGKAPAGLADPGLAALLTPVNVAFLAQADRLDPAALAHGLGPDQPALILHGTKDTQVTDADIHRLMGGFADDQAALAVEVPDADHLFKVVTGTPAPAVDYANAARPFAPQVQQHLGPFLQSADLATGRPSATR